MEDVGVLSVVVEYVSPRGMLAARLYGTSGYECYRNFGGDNERRNKREVKKKREWSLKPRGG